MNLEIETQQHWTNYVLEQYPNEACAFIVDGALYPVTNHSETPTETFSVSATSRLAAHAKGEVQAFLHSHPYKLADSPFEWDPAWATSHDMKSWIADNIPWGIVATDGEGLSPIIWYDDSIEAMEPYDGRHFISGKNDCYSLVRDYYRKEFGIPMQNYPRSMGWWTKGENLYAENFQDAGFDIIPFKDVVIGDILLMKIVGDVISHSAVIVGENQILHHVMNRLSGYDSMSKWYRQIVYAVRHKSRM